MAAAEADDPVLPLQVPERTGAEPVQLDQPCTSNSSAASIQEGDWVIVDVNGDKQSFISVKANGRVKVGKVYYSMAPFVGAPFGALFTPSPDNKSLVRCEYVPPDDWSVVTTDKNNATLEDKGGVNQALTTSDIAAMKASGASGHDIINALASNSATFDGKTEFSQSKYRKKKAKKYLLNTTLRRPTAASVCEAYFARTPARIEHLRVDTLAILLSSANVGSGAQVLVLESCAGLVTAAVAERLGGFGRVVSTYMGSKQPALDAPRLFNFSKDVMASISIASLPSLRSSATSRQENGSAAAGAAPGPTSTERGGATGVASADEAGLTAATGSQAEQQPFLPAQFNSCIVAAPHYSPSMIMDQLLPLLVPSTPFAVYSLWSQPLAECFQHLQSSQRAVFLQLQESWWRDYQVLPSRTHPTMQMSGTGGFILSGITVAKQSAAPPQPKPAATSNKKQRINPASDENSA